MRGSRWLALVLLGLVVMAGGVALVIAQTQFAEDRAGGEKTVPFDAKRAMGYLKQICELGPRISGTPEMEKQQELLKKHFESHGAAVELQRFNAQQRSRAKPTPMVNLIARWHPDRARRIILCAHYDTRPIADREPNPRDWQKPFLGANDGASGPAFMMELAHHMRDLRTGVGIDFVLFDGEEYIFNPASQFQGGDRYFFGSEHFAKEYQDGRRRNPGGSQYVAAVLVDMVAGKNARFRYEGNSLVRAGHLAEQVWKIAAEVGVKSFVPERGEDMLDDHLALLRVGIPAIDIIDMDYRHWHLLSDVPENCSGDTMEQVARVVVVWMQRAK